MKKDIMRKDVNKEFLLFGVLASFVVLFFVVNYVNTDSSQITSQVPATDQSAAAGGGNKINHFVSLGSMNYPRVGHLAKLMDDGRVIIVGGYAGNVPDEIYDPSTRTFSVVKTASSYVTTWSSAISVLSNGNILKAGNGPSEYYDKDLKTWTNVDSKDASLYTFRSDGRTLPVLGGSSAVLIGGRRTTDLMDTPKIASFDPSTKTWSDAGSMVIPRHEHCSISLSDGRIWSAMGLDPKLATVMMSEIYDPVTKTSSTAAPILIDRDTVWGYPLCTALPNNKAFIGGGSSIQKLSGSYYSTPIKSTEIFDAKTNTIVKGPDMLEPHGRGVATTLANGDVLVTGGFKLSNGGKRIDLSSAEIYNGSTFTSVGNMTTARVWHTATLLRDGSVLITGDGTAELYIP